MAINDEQTQSQQTGSQAPQQRTGAPAAKAGGWSFNNSGLFAAPIGRGVGSDYLNKLQLALAEVYKQVNSETEVTLLTIDNVNVPQLAFSAIVVCLRNKAKANVVGYHTLIVEATGEKVAPIFENINGNQVEIVRTTGAAFDRVLQTIILERVKEAFANCRFYAVDGCVVPRTFNVEDKHAIHQLALNAGLAVSTELAIHSEGFEDVNLAGAQQDSNLTINVAFAHQQIADAVGEPVRSDVMVAFTSQPAGNVQKSNSVNEGDRTAKLSELSGFVDVVWAPVQGAVFNPYANQGQPIPTQKYASRLVITNVLSNFACTPASILLAIATSLTLRDDSNWIQAFRPVAMPAGAVDMYDIGALGIEANFEQNPTGFGSRIDTKAQDFGLGELGKLVAALIQPGLIVSMDIPECGAQTWYTSLISAASNGDSGATNALYDAAMVLTNGNFGKYFPKGSQMFLDGNNRVHLGHYTDKNGLRRDIRDIDYLAVANMMGDRNPQTIRDWSDTITRTQYPLALRLAARKKIIYGLTGDSAEFTGFAQRVTFSGAFLGALAQGCRDAGLTVRVNTPLNGSDFNNERVGAGFVSGALMQPGQSFNVFQNYQQQYNSYQPTGMQNRW